MRKIIVVLAVLLAQGLDAQIYIDSYRFAQAAPVNLLLDDYPGAAAAYSLRKLDKDYTGSAIRIRTAAGSETDIGFDGSGNLNTAAITTFCAGTTCTVTTWYDQSGNGNNATQTTAANQPTIYTGGAVITDNSRPAIDFDGVNDNLAQQSNFAYGTFVSSFVVAKFDSGTGYKRILSGETDIYWYIGKTTAETIASFYGNGTTWGTVTSQSSTNWTTQRLVVSINQGTDYLYINGANAITRSNPMGSYTGKLEIGGSTGTPSQAGDSKIQEAIVYANSQLSNIAGFRTNINSYYSIY